MKNYAQQLCNITIFGSAMRRKLFQGNLATFLQFWFITTLSHFYVFLELKVENVASDRSLLSWLGDSTLA